ncbi:MULTISPECIES: ABC transporter permease [Undibacterium]|jgi:ABC-2 type transport system permease protein|uniref:ABC-2 transporter permease n=1 Tax=Undibacterium aquatile TaxID=1537398 RepID=A0ABR6XIC9_9BURK|nr:MULTISPECIES: ABC transporter permease [Undibacterium]MBC3812649.1 ABC-2 transporter permease [Undibacterium aquatile]MBC3877958.1 ABC-2 transporter permease [Undibacterium sp. FT79W]MBC3928897.1 ABC-2 transporter permease [Undibacterium sp. CY21W]
MQRHLANIYRLGVKELWSLWRDPMMLALIIYTFTAAIYVAGTAMPETLNRAPIAIVDEDDSALSVRIISAFYPPQFTKPVRINQAQVDPGLDAGLYTFVLIIPPDFQRDVIAGKAPQLQLNVDATRMSQAFSGNGAIQQIIMGEVNEFVQRYRDTPIQPVELALRSRFNPALNPSWFGSLMELVNNITMLSIILTGAALIREREHGTVEHLLVMPVTPTEIMLAKVWSMALVVLVAVLVSLTVIIQGALRVPIDGSIPLFLIGVTLHLFATTSMGIFMATLARSMPQFGLLMMLTMMPLEMLSGGMTPRESMPVFVQWLMSLAPTTHFTELSQAILYRGAGFEVVWRAFFALLVIGSVLFMLSLARFRKTLGQMA